MSKLKNTSSSTENSESAANTFDFKLFLHYSLKYWYFFAISLIVAYYISFLYIRYAKPVYAVNSTVMIKDGGYYSSKASGQMMEGLGMLKMSYNIFNELEIMKSYALIYEAVKSLDFEVSYFVSGAVKEMEVYQSSPILVELDSTAKKQLRGVPLYVNKINDSTYKLIIKEKASSSSRLLFWRNTTNVLKEYTGQFNKRLTTADFSITIKPTVFFYELDNTDGEYYFIINDLYTIASQYGSQLRVSQQSKYSSLVSLTITGGIVEKEINFLNALTDTYIKFGLDEKNEITNNTVQFIDDQLKRINDSLRISSNQLEDFSDRENFAVDGNSEKMYGDLELLEQSKAELQMQKKYYEYLLNYIEKNSDMKKVVSPSAVGIPDVLLNQLVGELYMLQSEQKSLAFSAKEKNHTFEILDVKIRNARANLLENLKNLIATSDLYLKDNQERLAKVYVLLHKLPKSQRYFANLQRQYSVNEKMYSLLLEKKTEAEIAKASNVSDNKVVNTATLSGKVFPNESSIKNNAMMMGLVIPLFIIALFTYFNSIVVDKAMIKRKTSLPILGSVGHFEGESMFPVWEYPKSPFADSVRALRINLQYLAMDKKNKVVGVTSTISGEGKTFFALNLALSLVQSGAKVILLGVDLRRPRLTNMLNMEQGKGISSYLIGKHTLEEIINKEYIDKLDIISAGPIPPNPSELLESKKFEDMIKKLRDNYDYVVMDSSPVGLVSDYLFLAKLTDINLFMIRQNVTKIGMLEDLEVFKQENGLSSLYLIYNDVKRSLSALGKVGHYGYGYGYGYNYGSAGYGENDGEGMSKPWYQKVMRRVRRSKT